VYHQYDTMSVCAGPGPLALNTGSVEIETQNLQPGVTYEITVLMRSRDGRKTSAAVWAAIGNSPTQAVISVQ